MMTPTTSSFKYTLVIDTTHQFSIIRFPNEPQTFKSIITFSQSLPANEFFSITRTLQEVSVIIAEIHKEAVYGAQAQCEDGFVRVQVVPAKGNQIDFGSILADKAHERSDRIIGEIVYYFSGEGCPAVCN
jgi:hypothetical protein